MRPLIFALVALMFALPVHSQTTTPDGWPVTQQCIPAATDAARSYAGTIFAYEPGTGIRGVQATMVTSYIVAFEGANFTGAAAISPDGRWLAVPSGLISFMTMVDETYQVNEIRVQSTAPSTIRVENRIAWSANYRGSDQDSVMRDIQWLDNDTLLYAHDNWELEPDEIEFATIGAFDDTFETIKNRALAQLGRGLSPDETRAFGLLDQHNGLYDVETNELLADFTVPRSHLAGWSPDSAQAAIISSTRIDNETIPQLNLIDRDGALISTITSLPVKQFVWSPDGRMLAFSVYDEERAGNILHIADYEAQSITDTCLPIRYGDYRTGYGLTWSPDGSALALMTESSKNPLQILSLQNNTLRYVDTYSEGEYSYLIAWGAAADR